MQRKICKGKYVNLKNGCYTQNIFEKSYLILAHVRSYTTTM